MFLGFPFIPREEPGVNKAGKEAPVACAEAEMLRVAVGERSPTSLRSSVESLL